MRFWVFICSSLSSRRREVYIVRKICSISSRLSLGFSSDFVFGPTGLITGGTAAGRGLGSASATGSAAKAFSGSSDSDFLTSLRTFVSLMKIVQALPGAIGQARAGAPKTQFLKLIGI